MVTLFTEKPDFDQVHGKRLQPFKSRYKLSKLISIHFLKI